MKQQETVNNEISQASRELASKHFFAPSFYCIYVYQHLQCDQIGRFFYSSKHEKFLQKYDFYLAVEFLGYFYFLAACYCNATPKPKRLVK